MNLNTDNGGEHGFVKRRPACLEAVAKRFSEFEKPVEWWDPLGIDDKFDGA